MPSGIADVEGQPTRCFELFEFRAGENLSLQFSEKTVPKQQGSTSLSEQDASSDREEDPETLFLWTDRNWGCLVKHPLPIKVDWLQRTRGSQIMLSVSTRSLNMEYIIVAGEALDKMKAEYGPKKQSEDYANVE